MHTPAVHRISIPNPYFEGANNAWLIAAQVPTLIDTAIGTPAAWETLVAGLKSHGYAPGLPHMENFLCHILTAQRQSVLLVSFFLHDSTFPAQI